MPKNKFEEVIFTLMVSGSMIFFMGVYNIWINKGGTLTTIVAHEIAAFPLEWLIGFILAFFGASKISKHLTFKIINPDSKPLSKILLIQTFTVCTMVPLMSAVGIFEAMGLTEEMPKLWIKAMMINFVVAYPLQLLIVGPACRYLFRWIFGKRGSMKIGLDN